MRWDIEKVSVLPLKRREEARLCTEEAPKWQTLSLFGGEGRSPMRRTLTPPGLFPWNVLGAPLYHLSSFRARFFLQTDRVPFGVRGKRGRDGGGAGLSRGCAHRGPSSHQRSATSRPRSQPLFKKTFPSGRPRLLPAPARGPGPRSTPLRPLV